MEVKINELVNAWPPLEIVVTPVKTDVYVDGENVV